MATVFQFPFRTVAEISIPALVKNAVTVRSLSKKEVIPVIKADAYGHGMLPVAKALVTKGFCETLAVATLEEALELRKKMHQSVSILVLSGFLPHQLDAYVKYHLTPVIHSLYHLKSLLVSRKALPPIHLKVDTGMNRLGITEHEFPEAVKVIEKLGIKLFGLMTHFAESEATLSPFIDQQIALFEEMHRELHSKKLLQTDALIHVANSGAALRHKVSISNAVRPGISLFGVSPNPRLSHASDLIPVLQWKTRVLAIKTIRSGDTVGYGRTYRARRKERIALLPVGYADGYPRLLSNVGEVLINGKRLAVRGRISLDLTAVDCTALPSLKEGTLVTLIGKDGKEEISAWSLANKTNTIPYEIFCGLSPRVSRVYLE